MQDFNERPSNNLLWAILSTLFCCLPLGIMSVISAAKVDGLYNDGKFSEARIESNKALKHAKNAFFVAVIISAIYFLFKVCSGGK